MMTPSRVYSRRAAYLAIMGILLISTLAASTGARPQTARLETPPSEPIRLIFIHHSTGGNWLADPNPDQPGGGLGRALMDSNYYVSATNYGWGPDSIGDRTEIINWPEWFTGPQSEAIMQAIYEEDGQNIGDFGDWPRLAQNPGGENQIIIFKSCFPNSDLWGNPNDDPLDYPGEDFTVANAKAVYINILTYFQSRQDKLFIIITAPPLAQGEYYNDAQSPAQRAANARAFNDWLVNEWLADYPYSNVAVFDYYNVLTSNGTSNRLDDPGSNQEPNDTGQEDGNHHRWWNGAIQHIQTIDNNFSAYPTSSDGDSHPTSQGHQKATAEFVTLLNVYYNLWQASEPPPLPADAGSAEGGDSSQDASGGSGSSVQTGTIDDMEADNLWESYPDGMGSTVESALTAQEAHSGSQSLRIDVDIIEGGWGDTGRYFEAPQDWSGADGLELWLHASQAGMPFSIVVFSGDTQAPSPFVLELTTSPDSASGWVQYALGWDEFALAEWADTGGETTLNPQSIVGFSVNHFPGQGTLWLDDVGLLNFSAPDEDQVEGSDGSGRICPLGMVLPGLLFAAAWSAGKRRL